MWRADDPIMPIIWLAVPLTIVMLMYFAMPDEKERSHRHYRDHPATQPKEPNHDTVE